MLQNATPLRKSPAALASLLFDPPEPQIIGKTQCFATFLPFCAPASSFFWLFLFSDLLSSTLLFSLTLPTSAFHLSILSEVWLLNFLWWIYEQLLIISLPMPVGFAQTLGLRLGRTHLSWASYHPPPAKWRGNSPGECWPAFPADQQKASFPRASRCQVARHHLPKARNQPFQPSKLIGKGTSRLVRSDPTVTCNSKLCDSHYSLGILWTLNQSQLHTINIYYVPILTIQRTVVIYP